MIADDVRAEERAAAELERKRARALKRAHAANAKANAARARENAREWRAWCEWLERSAAAYGAWRRAEASGDARATERASDHDRAVLRQCPPMPKGPRPW